MTDIAIRVENLSKLYRIGKAQQRHDTLRDALVAGLRAPLERLRGDGRGANRASEDTIWALKDVSFKVKRGEVLGIIGRNGAGKSTLLKILSRITEPTGGRAIIHGRVGSLLEVGTGFHPELTGRENIYLNGAILGMHRVEIGRKFDEIVDFAEIERFLDTPVKRYSSGMYVRLAFAVAAHLEPEILLVDEVLAVGDAAFQKKCLGKMGSVAREGRTVLFVSHNMAAVSALCSSGILLKEGNVEDIGQIEGILSKYFAQIHMKATEDLAARSDRSGKGPLRYTQLKFESLDGTPMASWQCGTPGKVVVGYRTEHGHPVSRANIGFSVEDSLGIAIFQCWTALMSDWPSVLPATGVATCDIPRLPLKPGRYSLNVYAEVNGEMSDWVVGASMLNVEEGDFYGTGSVSRHKSVALVDHTWQISARETNDEDDI
jgi:lipopolysaccharide transport system ATP-binding protein